MDRPYLIGTGYCENRCGHDVSVVGFDMWWKNTMKYASPKRVVVTAAAGQSIPEAPGDWIRLDGDLGHVHDLQAGRKDFHFCGWTISLCTLALIAYADECDFIYKEQDCFAFGPWVDQMKAEIGSAGIIFGSARCMPAVQSLVYMKHEFLPEFVKFYLGTGDERKKENEGEQKFVQMERDLPGKCARYSFGVDRDRPITYDAPVFYAQQICGEELAELRKRGLLE